MRNKQIFGGRSFDFCDDLLTTPEIVLSLIQRSLRNSLLSIKVLNLFKSDRGTKHQKLAYILQIKFG